MRKILALCIFAALLSGCGAPQAEKAALSPRENCVCLYDAANDGAFKTLCFDGYDLDNDGYADTLFVEKETQKELFAETNESVSYVDALVVMGDGTYLLEGGGAENPASRVTAVYLLDLDGASALAVFRERRMGDCDLTVLGYDGGAVSPLGESFHFEYLNTPSLRVTDGGIDVPREGVGGMWSRYVNYRIDGGELIETDADEYDIVPGFISNRLNYYTREEFKESGFSDEEIEMLKKDYALAHAAYYNKNQRTDARYSVIMLKEGDYFRLVKETADNWVYIEKSSGEEGWIDLDGWGGDDNREEVSYIAFYL